MNTVEIMRELEARASSRCRVFEPLGGEELLRSEWRWRGEDRRREDGEGPGEKSEQWRPEKQKENQERVWSIPEAGGAIPWVNTAQGASKKRTES